MRYSKRPTTIRSLVCSFDQKPLSHLTRTARGLIEKIRDDGRKHWKSNADEQKRWDRYCNDMINAMAFRASIYAITALWLDDKNDHTTMTLELKVETGKIEDDIQYTPATTPRKYRKRARGL